MYKFSKNSWHVKLFTWIFNENPTRTYKSMCPYFWSYVLIFMFFPLILMVKLFGKFGTQFLNYLRKYKENRREKIKQDFIKRASKENMTQKEGYDIVKTKCWVDNWYYLDSDIYSEIVGLYDKERNERADKKYELNNKKEEDKKVRIQKYKEYKESKWFTYISYVMSLGIIGLLGYTFYKLLSMINLSGINWLLVGKVSLTILSIGVGSVLFVLLIRYILVPIIDYLKCMECKLCKFGIGSKIVKIFSFVGLIFVFIWKGFKLVGDMIYVTYKKNCPLITWED